MVFKYDNQTFQDLEILKDYRLPSVYALFNNTLTVGGREYLKELIKCPLTVQEELESRVKLIQFFMSEEVNLNFNARQLNYIEKYINLNVSVLKSNPLDSLINRISERIKPSNNYHLIKSGIESLAQVLHDFTKHIDFDSIPKELFMQIKTINELSEEFNKAFEMKPKTSWRRIIKLDRFFRLKFTDKLHQFLKEIYFIDAFHSIAQTAKRNEFTLPKYKNSASPILIAQELKHPLLKHAISNDIRITEKENMVFLSGPNMAGKSTFLKSVGIAIYLAHLGFPVPAKAFTTSIYSGMITTINLSDDLSFGHSHFYSEVNRVKEAAKALAQNKRMFVIFDELFRGTNVKDAFEASTEIIKGFAKIANCSFFMSTHIVEIAEEIKEIKNIHFKYFDARLDGEELKYSYKIKTGVSNDRLGMYIVKKEGIFDLLSTIKNPV